jgi:hypothetical protein
VPETAISSLHPENDDEKYISQNGATDEGSWLERSKFS